jgi:peptide/nickel transport system ATP-binding protein/oligopeptide transport system ATP-binding protein
MQPNLLICDEAVSALDVSIQAQILGLFRELHGKLGLTYLFIAHGLGAVKYISDRIAVMYLGKIVEFAPTELIFADPRHPYTQALLDAFPDPDPRRRGREKIVLSGAVPGPASPSSGGKPSPTGARVPEDSGCRFRTRCPFSQSRCRAEEPGLLGEGGHFTACHFEINRSDWNRVKP